MKATELTLAIVHGPLDDLYDFESPLAKWQVREALHNFVDEVVDKIMESDEEYASIQIAARQGYLDTE